MTPIDAPNWLSEGKSLEELIVMQVCNETANEARQPDTLRPAEDNERTTPVFTLITSLFHAPIVAPSVRAPSLCEHATPY